VPLHATGVGKVLLAYGSDDLLAAVLAKELTPYTAHTIVVPGHLRRALTKVRRDGVAFANQEMSLGSVSVASPLLSEGSAIAALEVVVGADRSDLRRLATAGELRVADPPTSTRRRRSIAACRSFPRPLARHHRRWQLDCQ
jgi:DNA-binding IclR family transcriptional regulator